MGRLVRGAVGRLLSLVLSVTLVVGPALTSLSHIETVHASPSQSPELSAAVEASPTVVSEIEENRTETSREYLLSNGQVRAEYHTAPIHYRDTKTKKLTPIDLRLEDKVVNGRAVSVNKANSFRLELPKKLGSDWTSIEASGTKLSMRPAWTGRAGQARVKDGDLPVSSSTATEVVYTDAYQGATLEYESLPDGLKETIVLERPIAANVFGFKIKAEGLDAELLDDGSVVFRSTETSVGVFLIPAPFMEDSSDPILSTSFSDAVHYELTGSGPEYQLDVVASKEWLADPQRVYPVRIDPTTQVSWTLQGGNLGEDTYISSLSQGTNYVNSTLVWIKKEAPGSNGTEAGFFQPPTAMVNDMASKRAATDQVVQSHLRLHLSSAYLASPGTILARMGDPTKTISMGGITWTTYLNGAGSAVAECAAPNMSVTQSGTHTLVLTDMVAYWQRNATAHSRCYVRLVGNNGTHVGFSSAQRSSYRPVWEVTYAKQPTVALSAPVTGLTDTIPTFNWTFTAPSAQVRYQVELAKKVGQAYATVAPLLDNHSGATSCDPPTPLGGWILGETYYWRVRAASSPIPNMNPPLWSEWTPWSGGFTPRAPNAPSIELLQPHSGEVRSVPKARWTYQGDHEQSHFEVRVAKTQDGTSVAEWLGDEQEPECNLPIPSGGWEPGAEHYFQVRAGISPPRAFVQTVWSDWSSWGTFTPVVPSLVETVSAEATAYPGWFSQNTSSGAVHNDYNGQGRGSVTVTWTPSPSADGYRVYLFDGSQYRNVGATLGENSTTWTSDGAGVYPRDSAAAGLVASGKSPFAGASSPSSESFIQKRSVPSSVDARVLLTQNGSSFYARAQEGSQWYWANFGDQSPNSSEITYFRNLPLSGKLALSAFYFDQTLYNGYAITANQVDFVTTALGDTNKLTFSQPLLDRSTGLPLTGSSANVMLAACQQESTVTATVYSIANAVEGVSGSGYTIREYSLQSGQPLNSRVATFVTDHVIEAPSFPVGGAISTPDSLILIEEDSAWSNRRILKLNRRNDLQPVNEWASDQQQTRVSNGCYYFSGTGSHFALGSPKVGSLASEMHVYRGQGLDLRDNPNPLYQLTSDSKSDWRLRNDYNFVVQPFSADFGEPALTAETSVTVAIDNRTVETPADPRHTSFELGDIANGTAEVQLDTASLLLEVTDLDIDSYGPDASLSRRYSSAQQSSDTFAPGWRFDFERQLEIETDRITYIDEDGDRRTFVEVGDDYQAPVGYHATLKRHSQWFSSDTYTLAFKDRVRLTFHADGRLKSETDRNGQATEYEYELFAPTRLKRIIAANGRAIDISLDGGGRVESARFETPDGTREVSYAYSEAQGGGSSTAAVTYFPGQDDEYTLEYQYSDERLTRLHIPGQLFAGLEARWDFAYRGAELSTLTAPSRPGNWRPSMGFAYELDDTAISQAVITRQADVEGKQETIFQEYGWNPTGTLAYRTVEYLEGESPSRWTYEYSSTNETIREVSPSGKLQQRDLNVRGHVLAEHDEDHHVVSYAYDENVSDGYGVYDQMTSKMDPRGNVTYFSYDSNGNVTETKRRLTHSESSETRYEYDSMGRQKLERTLLWSRDGDNRWLQEANYYVDGAGKDCGLDKPTRVVKTAEREVPAGETSEFHAKPINLGGNETTTSITTTTEYDAFGNVLKDVDAAGVVVLDGAVFSTGGKLVRSIDVEGVTARNRYDALGRLVETSSTVESNPHGSKVSNWNRITIDAEGRTLREESLASNGVVNTWADHSFDAMGRSTESTDSAAGKSVTWYDARGNAVATWEPGTFDPASPDLEKATRAKYDIDGLELWACDAGKPESAAVKKEHRANGLLAKITEADGAWTTYLYDAAENVVAEISPTETGGTVIARNFYDEGGRLFQTESAEGMISRTHYDLADRPVATYLVEGEGDQEVATLATGTEYNELGWEILTTDADGVKKSKQYDALGNVVRDQTIDSSDTAVSTVDYVYDAKKRLLRQTSAERGGASVIGYAYDAFGRSIEESHTKAGAAPSKWVRTTYDEYDRPLTIKDEKRDIERSYSYAGGAKKRSTEALSYGSVTTTTTVDELDRETTNTAQFSLNGGSVDVTRAVEWDAVRTLPVGSTLQVGPGSWTTAYTYDYGDKLKSVSGGIWAQGGVSASYNDTGTATKLADTVTLPWGGATQREFGYTAVGRLDKVTITNPNGSSRTTTYTWDPDGGGNLEEFTDAGVTTTLSYEGGRLASRSTGGALVTYGFDDAGRRVLEQIPGTSSEPTRSIETSWTGEDRLLSWQRKIDGAVTSSAYYKYDGEGQRVSATVYAPNPWSATPVETVYTYGWDGLELRWMKADSPVGSARLTYLYDESDRPYAAAYEETVGGDTNSAILGLLMTDHGDIVGLADASGQQFARYAYGPFGEAEGAHHRATSELTDALAQRITAFQPLRYACYNYDNWSEHYYLQARYYDPTTKQFLSKDPAEADGEESAYQYCAGDPINQDDPDGEFAQVVWGAVGGAAWYAGGQAIKGAWKARSVYKKQGFKAGARATWKNVKKSWSWKQFGKEVAFGAATGGVGRLAQAGKFAKYGRKAAGARCRVLSKGSRYVNKVSRGRIPAKAYCFVAGTLVVTSAGAVPIEAIEVGDMVLSRDSATGEQALRPVTELYRNEATELVHVDLGDETITATPEHPFWVEGTGWVDAAELAAGDEVARADGGSATIVSVVREHLQSPVDVYNFEVAEYHTYFVASAGVWVHNACGRHRHHAFPKFMGGPSKGHLANMSAKSHKQLHRDLNAFLDSYASRNIRGVARTMRTKSGWSGEKMRRVFSESQRRQAMIAFYNGPGAKYTAAKKAFRKTLVDTAKR